MEPIVPIITQEILKLIGEIDELKGQWRALKTPICDMAKNVKLKCWNCHMIRISCAR
jgi:hypothetical protein